MINYLLHTEDDSVDRSATTLIVSHRDDLDGVASAILMWRYAKAKGLTPVVVFASYNDVAEILLREAHGRMCVIIGDISLRDAALIDGPLSKYEKNTLFVFDHHENSEETLRQWESYGQASVNLIFDGSMCTADIVAGELSTYEDISPYKPLISATHSRDLWIKDDINGDYLSDVIKVLGADSVFDLLIEDLSRVDYASFTPEMLAAVKQCEQELQNSIALARDTVYHSGSTVITASGYHVLILAAVCDGYCSEVGAEMGKWYSIPTIACLIDAHGNSLEFRMTQEDVDKTQFKSNAVAFALGGGGHPCASGAPLPKDFSSPAHSQDVVILAERVKEIITSLCARESSR